jgi:hypothetical protein
MHPGASAMSEVFYKTRSRGGPPRQRDKVWVQSRHPHKSPHGFITSVDYNDRMVVVYFEKDNDLMTLDWDDLSGRWNDTLGYLIEDWQL